MSDSRTSRIDQQEMLMILLASIVVLLLALIYYRFELVAYIWKWVRLPSLILSDYLIPDSVEVVLGYHPSQALDWVQSNTYKNYNPNVVLTLEKEYIWFTRVVFSAALFFGSYQIVKYRGLMGKPLTPEEYLKLIEILEMKVFLLNIILNLR